MENEELRRAKIENNKENRELREENKKIKDNIGLMHNETVDKNDRILQLMEQMRKDIEEKKNKITLIETINQRLYMQNTNLNKLCFGGKQAAKNVETGIQEKEEDDCRRGKKEESRERKKEEDECGEEEMEEIRERKKETNHPTKICYFWTQGYCKKNEQL